MSKFFQPCLVTALFLTLSSQSPAKQIYQWTDANGVVHFSDTPPPDKSAAKGLTARLIDVDPQDPVRLRPESGQGEISYFAYNDLGGPVSLSIQLTQALGISTQPRLPTLISLPSKREIPALTVKAVGSSSASTSFSLSYQWTPGDPAAQPDLSAVYRLPFRNGLAFAVHQGFGGTFSHNTPENFHALDLALPKGTEVLAARAGVVMQVQDDFYRNGLDLNKYGERANVVVILHSDGTLGVYAHLDLESVVVGVGRRVDAGALLGKSGNTGFSSGPHLHFVVQYNHHGQLKSVPFAFTVDGAVIEPKLGMVLQAR
jgi:murein DD-endopeptidase MepM/ murein hydrolase activator NlpD